MILLRKAARTWFNGVRKTLRTAPRRCKSKRLVEIRFDSLTSSCDLYDVLLGLKTVSNINITRQNPRASAAHPRRRTAPFRRI